MLYLQRSHFRVAEVALLGHDPEVNDLGFSKLQSIFVAIRHALQEQIVFLQLLVASLQIMLLLNEFLTVKGIIFETINRIVMGICDNRTEFFTSPHF